MVIFISNEYSLSVNHINLYGVPPLLYTAVIKLDIFENSNPVNWTLLTFSIKKSDNSIIVPIVNDLNHTLTINSLLMNTDITIEAISIGPPIKTSNIVSISFKPADASKSNIKYSKSYLSKRTNKQLNILVTVLTSNNIPIYYNIPIDFTII